MDEFPFDNLDPTVSDDARLLIADLVLAWGTFDTVMTAFTVRAFGMRADLASILLGEMQTKTKFQRLKKAFDHHGNKTASASLAKLSKQHEEFSGVRNKIAHWQCLGSLRDKKGWLVFSALRHIPKQIGALEISEVHLSEIHAAAQWAVDASASLTKATEQLEQHLSSQQQAPG